MTHPSTQRLFAAVVPPEHVLEHLEDVVGPMRVARSDLRWMPPRFMHVTLAFMPHVPDDAAEALPEALVAPAAQAAPLRLRIAGSGRFDEHVLWTGVDGDVDALTALAAAVVSAAAAVGASPERRPYRPHLTLARGTGSLDARLGGLAAAVDAYEGPVWQPDVLQLVRSNLGRSPRYETVAELPLGA